jgi:N-acyl-D-amino-acid deacylase
VDNARRASAAATASRVRCSRRAALRSGATGLAALAAAPSVGGRVAAAQATPASDLPISGPAVPELAALDAASRDLVANWGLPGALLAVGYEGRLVFDRGYGYADLEAGEAVEPNHRFRVASVTKTITAVGVMALVEAGELALSDKVFPLLDLEPPANATVDPRLDEVTVEHLLVHAGGWDSSASGDPQYVPMLQLAASVLGEPGPPDGESIVRFMLGSGLDFDPGTKSVYSNFGFNVAGRVIEQVTGQAYGTFIQERVLAPAGIATMQLGKTRLEERAADEVRYYQPPEYPATVPGVFPGEGFVPFAYGSFFLDAMDAHGGWIGRASDLVRYATAIDGARGEPLLRPEIVTTMLGAPRPAGEGYNGAANTDPATGLGWVVQAGPLGREWAHTGALGGSTAALLLRNDEGVTLSFVTNTLPADFVGFFGTLRPALTGALAAVATWPTHDLFAAGV